ncbi:basic secretory protein-like protein [Hymenobacter terrenus]|uniref:basic secretory protein-like protein n=1 Tax=Hymenobacter terrenus TaxID=1629124 RepID=UPI0006196A8A|nr:basic secretory protein-like protein [Hymenobacter terrenus]
MKKRNTIEHLLLAMALMAGTPALAQQDITNSPGGVVSAEYDDSPLGEEIGKLTDNLTSTKYLTFHASGWVQFQSPSAAVVTKYALTSANDVKERDPSSWTFQGSNNGNTWTTLDTRSNQVFASRFLRKEFSFTNSTPYLYYRLQASTNAYPTFQLAEWEIYTSLPVSPSAQAQITSPANNAVFTAPASITITASATASGGTVRKVDFFSGSTRIAVDSLAPFSYTWAGVRPGTYVLTAKATASTGTVSPASAPVTIQVNDSTASGWESFKYPEIVFRDLSPSSPGSQVFRTAIPDPVADMRAQILTLVKKLHYNANDNVRSFTRLNFTIEDYDGVASKSGAPPVISIRVSTRHLQNVFNNSNGDYNAIRTEILGILSHEGTHGYQYEPKNAGEYDGSSEFYGFIEGLADAVRISVGLHPGRTPQLGGNWRNGYTTSGFFIYWMALKKDPDFMIKFQNTARTYANWSWDAACRDILGVGVQPLWNEYQTWIRNGRQGLRGAKAPNVPAVLAMEKYPCMPAAGATQTHGDALSDQREESHAPFTVFVDGNTLAVQGAAEISAVNLYSTTGSLIKSSVGPAAGKVNISTLADGLYFVVIQDRKGGVQKEKVLICR